MALHSHPALAALSPDDFGRVTAMAAALPEDVDLSDERAIILHLHWSRFEAPHIAVLVPFVVAKARELREFFGLTSVGEAIGSAGFALALLSFSFLACVLDPAEADAAEALSVAASAGESAGPAVFLMTAGAVGALCILAIGAFDAPHGLRKRGGAALSNDPGGMRSAASGVPYQRIAIDLMEARYAADLARLREHRRRAWHIYIAMGMGGEL